MRQNLRQAYDKACDISTGKFRETAVERFVQFQANSLLGLRNLDLLNVAISIILIPTFFALFAAHRRGRTAAASLSLVIFLIGTTVFIAGNRALPMMA